MLAVNTRIGRYFSPRCPFPVNRAHRVHSGITVHRFHNCTPQCTAASTNTSDSNEPGVPEKKGILTRVREFFFGDKLDKARLGELGMGAFAAYGFFSNVNASILLTITWVTFKRQTGMTPLVANQWPKFLAIYAGWYAVAGILRPLRLSFAVATAPVFDGFMKQIQDRFKCARPLAYTALLACVAISSCVLLAGLIATFGSL